MKCEACGSEQKKLNKMVFVDSAEMATKSLKVSPIDVCDNCREEGKYDIHFKKLKEHNHQYNADKNYRDRFG